MVKECGINDASQGSLSSYAYIILMIHYLQKVGVLPVLQELYDGQVQPEEMYEGFNTWYQNDKNIIYQSFQTDNSKSLSRLWIGFLQYFTQSANLDTTIVQIRQNKTLMKYEKGWEYKPICIEDPFELTHNLGQNVTEEILHRIAKIFHLYLTLAESNSYSIG